MSEDTKYTEENLQEVELKPVEPAKIPDTKIDESSDEDEESLTIVEKFVKLEMETKIGLITTLLFLFALIFSWHWFNLTWWLVLILGIVGLKTLYTQMTDLKDEKPAEAKLAKYSFMALIALLILRDLYITSYLSDVISYLPIK